MTMLVQLEALAAVASASSASSNQEPPLAQGQSSYMQFAQYTYVQTGPRWGAMAAFAIAVLFLVTGAQLAVIFARRLSERRQRILEIRQRWETDVFDVAVSQGQSRPHIEDIASGLETQTAQGPIDSHGQRKHAVDGTASRPSLRRIFDPYRAITQRWYRRLDDSSARDGERVSSLWNDPESRSFVRLSKRFGMEPSWAFKFLQDGLRLNDAAELTREAKILESRWAGQTAALCIYATCGLAVMWALYPAGYALLRFGNEFTFFLWPLLGAIYAVIIVGFILWVLAIRRSADALSRHYDQFYARVEALLELHRFDIYRALALPEPVNTAQEHEALVFNWRAARTPIRYVHEAFDVHGAPKVPAVEGQFERLRDQVGGLTNLLRGPELVPYEGYVSWRVRSGSIDVAFGRTPMFKSGNARLVVSGSSSDAYAPFEISADSAQLQLKQVRLQVAAPVNGKHVSTAIDFERLRPDGGDAPSAGMVGASELWLEITQRGRFVQLLKVIIDATSNRQNPDA